MREKVQTRWEQSKWKARIDRLPRLWRLSRGKRLALNLVIIAVAGAWLWGLAGYPLPTAEMEFRRLERASLDADFVEALAELYPTCEAFYFQNCGKLLLAEDVRSHQIEGSDRFIRFGVNVRFFNIEGTEDMLIDTVGMSTLFLPDLQYHFHGMDPNWVVNHAYNVASYILKHDNPIQDGETVDGVENGQMSREIQWKCQYEDAMIQPPRGVLDINMGDYASGKR